MKSGASAFERSSPAAHLIPQGCGTAHALDVVGDRWALLVVRELVFGPKRFTDLRGGLPGIGPNVLSQRLKELEAAGVLRRRVLPPPAGSTVYELTEWGAELEEVLVRSGAVKLDGDRAAFSRFPSLFRFPPSP
jgi:DNA-binding HxlR family transcriptional regulator